MTLYVRNMQRRPGAWQLAYGTNGEVVYNSGCMEAVIVFVLILLKQIDMAFSKYEVIFFKSGFIKSGKNFKKAKLFSKTILVKRLYAKVLC